MGDWQWRAWVGTPGAGKLGAAFLVTPTRLLTCAHTVTGLDDPRVGFPGLAEDLPARVVASGGWRSPGDVGDVAVLELEEPVPFEPAALADPDDAGGLAAGGREFGVYGFPARKDDNERHATVTTGPHLLTRNEWWEIRTVHGVPLEKGYSGSAVYDIATGEVIGMVTDAELRGGRAGIGWMLPLSRLRAHWEPLDDLLPLRWLTGTARSDLRALLKDVPFTEALAADLERAVGRRPRERFGSAWASVRYVAEGFPEQRLAGYLGALGGRLPEPHRRRFAAWARWHLPGVEPAREAPAPASVIVRLEHATFPKEYDLTVHTWFNDADQTAQATVRVPESEVRGTVQDAVALASRALVGGRWMIEFAVPEGWLGKPFERWYIDVEDRTPMRRYPLVVRDVKRLRPGSIRRDQAHQRWRVLKERGRTDPRVIGCDDHRGAAAFQDWLEANPDHCALVYTTSPSKARLAAALGNGVPVMLWTRTTCSGPAHDDCQGHRLGAALAAAVRDARPEELPHIALDLRRKALGAPKDAPHCGRDLTLLWDDPSRLPADPRLAMEE
ncbi:trypsin-like peptidase domain-containing protein [Spirillospora sp. NPDC046719]